MGFLDELGSSTFVTRIVPSFPCALWNSMRSLKGNSEITSELRTKKGPPPSLRMARAWARGPALTRASTWCSRIGLFANSTRGFGFVSVSGLNRVPYPPTRIKAFMIEQFPLNDHLYCDILPSWPFSLLKCYIQAV